MSVAESPERRKRRIRPHLRAVTRFCVAIGATTRAKTLAVFPTHRLRRERQSDHLLKKASEVDLTSAEPAGLELVAQEYPVAGECRGTLRIGGDTTSRRFEHQPEAFANRLTIAIEAPHARQLERAVDLPLQVEIFAHAVDTDPEFKDPVKALLQLQIAAAALLPPRGSHAEEKLGGAFGQSVGQDFHAAGHPTAGAKPLKRRKVASVAG
jgi:hypothetical protein